MESLSFVQRMEAVTMVDPPANCRNDDGPLVAVTFQKNPNHKLKYLESEPKALGVTQILLGVFQISMTYVTVSTNNDLSSRDLVLLIGSLLVIIAGSLAIAAKNLHLPTLKACLGMQVVACSISVINIMVSAVLLTDGWSMPGCWYLESNNTELRYICHMLMESVEHLHSEGILIHAALIAISATLGAYCCKVVHCCSPKSNMPVITINAPLDQQ